MELWKIFNTKISREILRNIDEYRTTKSRVLIWNEMKKKIIQLCCDWRIVIIVFSVVYKQASLKEEPSVLLDPNGMSSDGSIALKSLAFSNDGNLMAYSFSKSGSDWEKIRIRNVDTGEDYPETLEGVKFSATSWTRDNKGFFYSVIFFKTKRFSIIK